MKRLRQLLPGLSTTVGVSAVVGAAMLAALPVKAEQTKLTSSGLGLAAIPLGAAYCPGERLLQRCGP